MNKHPAAIEKFSKILSKFPDHYSSLKKIASSFQVLGESDQAERYLQLALKQNPLDVVVLARLGIINQALGNIDKAFHYYRSALEHKPDFAAVLNNLSAICKQQGLYHEGLEAAQKAVAIEPDNPVFLTNLGNLQVKLNYFDRARQSLTKAVALESGNIDYLVNLSAACLADHDLEAGFRYIQQALEIEPDDPGANWQNALLLLTAGEWQAGFKAYDWRWKKPDFKGKWPRYIQPVWDGTPQPEKTLLVWTEQGYGDTIQFSRYLTVAAPLVRDIKLLVQPSLVDIFSDLGDRLEVFPTGNPLPEFDFHLPLFGLAPIFTTGKDSIPDPVYINSIESKLPGIEELNHDLKVGLCWAGNPEHENDHNRSLQLDQFIPILDKHGFQFFSLQVGKRRMDIEKIPAELQPIDLGVEFVGFSDTVKAIGNLDLIITVDTVIAHLAGSIGKPVWLLLPYQSDWRWMFDRSDSPWYPSMRIFRQNRKSTWEPVITMLNRALSEKADSIYSP